MKDAWPRTRPLLAPDAAALRAMLAPLTGEAPVAVEPLTGGLGHTTLKVTCADRAPLVLRLFQGPPEAAAFEAALGARFAAGTAMPPVLSWGLAPLPHTVMPFVPGTPPHRLWPRLDAAGRRRTARAIGAALAAIHRAASWPQTGLLAPDLTLAEPFAQTGAGLCAFLRACLTEGPGGRRLGPELTAAVLRTAAADGHRLDPWTARPCLVHSDFNPFNLLVEEGRVTAVLDWEFAHAGIPPTDLGNMLRPPFQGTPGFAEALAEGYADAGGWLREDWRRAADLADLFAWADILRRESLPDIIVRDARRRVAHITNG